MKKRQVYLILIIFILLVSCSQIELGENETEKKEELYGQALKELTADNSTLDPGLDKRYNYLQNQIDRVLSGEKELDMATFTQFKIELDYLSMSGYSSVKTGTLSADFMKTFTEAEQVAGEKDWGSSLGDRYYSLNKEIEELSTSETKMKVVEYLQIEKGIKELEEDGYPVPSKINDLRNQLFKIVVTELESAIVNYEVPEMEEIIEEEKVVEEVEEEAVAEEEEEEEAEIVPYKEEEKEEAVEEPTGPKTYLVELVNGGFSSSSMEIKTGDTIKWNNVRTGQYKIALILGNRECRFVKSNIFKNGESYNATFTEPMECWISDGIFTTQAMKVIVS